MRCFPVERRSMSEFAGFRPQFAQDAATKEPHCSRLSNDCSRVGGTKNVPVTRLGFLKHETA
jgi:hypothetical protein